MISVKLVEQVGYVMSKKTIIYARVPTIDQGVDFPSLYYTAQLNMQVEELKRVALQRNWEVTKIILEKKTGVKGRSFRQGLDDLLTAVTKQEVDVVMVWDINRLGRSVTDLVATMDTINNAGANMYIHTQGIDTHTASGRAMFGMISIFAEFEKSMIKERVRSGLAMAKSKGVKLGRPTVKKRLVAKIEDALREGKSVRMTAKELKSSIGTVSRIRQRMSYGI